MNLSEREAPTVTGTIKTEARQATEPGIDNDATPQSRGARSYRGAGHHPGLAWIVLQRFGLLLALVVALVVFSLLRPQSFATSQNFASILTGSAALTLISLGIMLPLIVQQYDLSVGYVATISSLLTAVYNRKGVMGGAK